MSIEKKYVSMIAVDDCSFDGVLSVVSDNIVVSAHDYISITNTESMYHALRNKAHFEYINHAAFSLCDGIGSVIAAFFWGHRIPRRNGPIFMLKAIDYGQKLGWRHYFYGGGRGVADEMVRRLKQQFPDMISCGTCCPPFRELTSEEEHNIVQMIINAKPDIVWVGLGLLKQEKWIADHLDKLNVPWMVGVGAAFDYHSGNVPWAPAWVQAVGMEWLFRTIIQPHKRIKRYYWSFIFMFESIWHAILHRTGIKKFELKWDK